MLIEFHEILKLLVADCAFVFIGFDFVRYKTVTARLRERSIVNSFKMFDEIGKTLDLTIAKSASYVRDIDFNFLVSPQVEYCDFDIRFAVFVHGVLFKRFGVFEMEMTVEA